MFIGQEKIVKEFGYIIPRARDELEPYNILLSARTGYGKTFLGLQIIQRIGTYQILIEEIAEEIVRKINAGNTRVNFIDEVHIVRGVELLYPLMDSGKFFFLFATNQSFELPEALKRRCIPLVFERYTKGELADIAEENLSGLEVDRACLDEIVKASVYSPGNIKVLCLRLRTIFHEKGGFSLQELKEVLVEILNIQDGLDVRCREYLEVLERIEFASLDSMAYIMGVSRDTIKTEVEPTLLSKDLIQITSKGRSLK